MLPRDLFRVLGQVVTRLGCQAYSKLAAKAMSDIFYPRTQTRLGLNMPITRGLGFPGAPLRGTPSIGSRTSRRSVDRHRGLLTSLEGSFRGL